MSIFEKTFIEALSFFSSDPQRAKKYLTDKRLSNSEKTILRSYFLYRSNKFSEVLDELNEIKHDVSPLVESQRQLLYGLNYNNQSQFKLALEHIEQSITLMRDFELPYFKLIGLMNMFIIHYNLKNVTGMSKAMDRIKVLNVEAPKDKIRILLCELKFKIFMDDLTTCDRLIEQIDVFREYMPESDHAFYLISKLEILVRMEKLEECYSVLSEVKQYRKFNWTQNYNYIKLLLDHYCKQTPLYIEDHLFKDHHNLYHQLKVIQQLEERDIVKAKDHWNILKESNPEAYHDEFKYQGGKTLFSLCLEKHSQDKFQATKPETDLDVKFEILFKILSEADAPIRKELLFEMLWGHPPETKNDFQRLSKCVYRLKLKFRAEVNFRKGCYSLEISTKKQLKRQA